MMNASLSVIPENDEEAAMVLSAFTTMAQSMALKGISITLSVNHFPEDIDEDSRE